MVELQKFNNQEEARVALGYLHANGIDAELEGAETFSTMPHVGMGATILRLVVPKAQLAEARRLMADAAEGANALDGGESEYDYGDDEEADGQLEYTFLKSNRLLGIGNPELIFYVLGALGFAFFFLFSLFRNSQ